MVDINLIINLTAFSLALISIFFGSTFVRKTEDKLKLSILSLIIILILLALYQIGNILNLYNLFTKNILIDILFIATILLILFALININKIISGAKKTPRKKKEK